MRQIEKNQKAKTMWVVLDDHKLGVWLGARSLSCGVCRELRKKVDGKEPIRKNDASGLRWPPTRLAEVWVWIQKHVRLMVGKESERKIEGDLFCDNRQDWTDSIFLKKNRKKKVNPCMGRIPSAQGLPGVREKGVVANCQRWVTPDKTWVHSAGNLPVCTGGSRGRWVLRRIQWVYAQQLISFEMFRLEVPNSDLLMWEDSS